jgi:hypothetical protein
VTDRDVRFVSEPIEPLTGRFDATAMVRGEPGLPEGFTWHGVAYRIEEVLETGKGLAASMGETYVRRHTFRLRMDDGGIWNVYFLRQAPGWFLLSVHPA